MTVEMSKKRGPKGLASTKAKKQKVQNPPDEAEGSSNTTVLDSESKTIALPADLDDEDEVGQLVALYETAVEHLNGRKTAAALPIVNGTIHEADRILRNASDVTDLPFEFHRVYASALLDLSLLIDDEKAMDGESSEDFIKAAVDRCNTAYTNGKGQGMSALKITNARCLCRQIQHRMTQATATLSESLPVIKKAMSLIDASFKVSFYGPLQLSQTLDIIQDFADSLLEKDPSTHESMNKWAESIWTKVLTENQEDVSALEGCGRVWLSLAQPSLSAMTDALDDDPATAVSATESARQALETSVELLNQALKCAENEEGVTGDLLCLLAEATISLASTFDDGPHYDKLEQHTISLLGRAEQIEGFDMPDRLREILRSQQDPDGEVSENDDASTDEVTGGSNVDTLGTQSKKDDDDAKEAV